MRFGPGGVDGHAGKARKSVCQATVNAVRYQADNPEAGINPGLGPKRLNERTNRERNMAKLKIESAEPKKTRKRLTPEERIARADAAREKIVKKETERLRNRVDDLMCRCAIAKNRAAKLEKEIFESRATLDKLTGEDK